MTLQFFSLLGLPCKTPRRIGHPSFTRLTAHPLSEVRTPLEGNSGTSHVYTSGDPYLTKQSRKANKDLTDVKESLGALIQQELLAQQNKKLLAMDAVVPPNAAAGDSPSRSRGDGYRGGRGRGARRGRGGSFNDTQNGGDRQSDNQYRGGRGGGRRAHRGSFGGEVEHNTRAMGNLSLSPLKKLQPTVESGEKKDEDEEVEAEVCFICASPVVHNSVAPCNHRTCHICALRMRALYKTKDCAHCRVCSPSPFGSM